MTINVYASVMPGEPDEVYHDHGVTVEQWLRGHAPDYQPGDVQPVTVFVNGSRLAPGHWAERVIAASDLVEIRVSPRGDVLDVFNVVFPFFGGQLAAAKAIQGAFTPDMPGESKAGQQGSEVAVAEAKANVARLGANIPEVMGRHIRYPDYLCQPRRFFAEPRSQSLNVFMCVSKGYCSIDESLIKIGETPVNELGSSVNYQIFGPGENVTSHPAHENWYNAPEVGASTGSAGLRLKPGAYYTQRIDANLIEFEGTEIRVPYGAGDAPADWEVGMVLQASIFSSVTIINEGQDTEGNYLRDTLEGEFRTFAEDDDITITGDSEVEGRYLVASFTDGTPDQMTLNHPDLLPAVFLPAGTYMLDADYTGVRYRIDAILTEQVQVGTVEVDDGQGGTTTEPVYETRRLGFDVTRLNPNGTEDTGWAGFPTTSTADASVLLDSSELSGDWAGPFAACPGGEVTSTIEWDVFAPQGLGRIDDDGDINARSRGVQLQYREYGSLEWIDVTEVVSGRTRDQLGWTFTVNLPYAMRPEVRVRRTSGEDTSTQSLDRLEWFGLRAKLPAPSSYEGVTTIAMTINGSDAIASQSENQINLVPVRMLEPVAGGPLAPSRSIADVVAHIARDIGYSDERIDVEELQRLDAIWDARGDRFDYVFSDNTAKEAINTALRAGFAEMTIARGIITPARDEPRTQFEQSYSPENMTGTLKRNFESRRPEEHDGVEVEYMNADTWTTETVLCLLPGDNGFKLDKVKLKGVVSKTQAWRIGMRRRRAQRYRRWTYSFETELDALNSNYLSYVALIDNVPGYGQSAILRDIVEDDGGARLTVTEPMEWEDGENHVVAYRDAYGDLQGPFPASQGANQYEIIADIPEPWPAVSAFQEPPHVYFGTASRWSFPALISEISPGGPLSARVQATNYDSRVYEDDDATPPA